VRDASFQNLGRLSALPTAYDGRCLSGSLLQPGEPTDGNVAYPIPDEIKNGIQRWAVGQAFPQVVEPQEKRVIWKAGIQICQNDSKR